MCWKIIQASSEVASTLHVCCSFSNFSLWGHFSWPSNTYLHIRQVVICWNIANLIFPQLVSKKKTSLDIIHIVDIRAGRKPVSPKWKIIHHSHFSVIQDCHWFDGGKRHVIIAYAFWNSAIFMQALWLHIVGFWDAWYLKSFWLNACK